MTENDDKIGYYLVAWIVGVFSFFLGIAMTKSGLIYVIEYYMSNPDAFVKLLLDYPCVIVFLFAIEIIVILRIFVPRQHRESRLTW